MALLATEYKEAQPLYFRIMSHVCILSCGFRVYLLAQGLHISSFHQSHNFFTFFCRVNRPIGLCICLAKLLGRFFLILWRFEWLMQECKEVF